MDVQQTFFKHVTFIYTDKCNARCAHCGSSCGPDRNHKLSAERVIENLWVLPKLGIPTFTITGGEPFIYFSEIQKICSYGKRLNLKFNIGTNGFWAKDFAYARHVLSLLRNLGLYALLLSYDRFHQKYIKIANIFNLTKAAASLQIKTKITVDMTKNDEIGKAIVKRLVEELRDYDCVISIKEPFLIGRAKYNIPETSLSSYPIDHMKITSPCHLLYYPSVNSDGSVITCCTIANVLIHESSPLYLGNMNEELLDDILQRAKRNLFLRILTRKGPVELKRILESSGQYLHKKNFYHSPCELCCELLGNPTLVSILERHLGEEMEDSCSRSDIFTNEEVLSHE